MPMCSVLSTFNFRPVNYLPFKTEFFFIIYSIYIVTRHIFVSISTLISVSFPSDSVGPLFVLHPLQAEAAMCELMLLNSVQIWRRHNTVLCSPLLTMLPIFFSSFYSRYLSRSSPISSFLLLAFIYFLLWSIFCCSTILIFRALRSPLCSSLQYSPPYTASSIHCHDLQYSAFVFLKDRA